MTGTTLIRRTAIDRRGLGFVDPGYASYDDYLLYLTIALDWEIAHDERVVMRYRRHSGNLTNVLFAGNLPWARASLLELFVKRFPDASDRVSGQLRRTRAEQLVLAAAHERHSSRRRAARWVVSAARQDLQTSLRTAFRVARDKLLATAKS
jgi:hypothetical protein